MFTNQEIQRISELCFIPTNLSENVELVKFHKKVYDLDFDVYCTECIDKAKMNLLREAFSQLINLNLRNGQLKNK